MGKNVDDTKGEVVEPMDKSKKEMAQTLEIKERSETVEETKEKVADTVAPSLT